MDESSCAVEFFWEIDNFCFCDFYSNVVLNSPEFTVRAPVECRWLLYMFPNGHGDRKYVGIYLKRQMDDGPKEITVRFKISLMDADGSLCPDEPSLEKVFTKDCEWGHNEFIERSDIVTGSLFLPRNALTIVCKLCFVEQNQPQIFTRRQASSQPGEKDEIRNVCKALALLHEDELHSDMILQGNTRGFNVHRCILSARVPGMYNRVRSEPGNIFKDDFTTEKFLSYAYTGELDMNYFSEFTLVNLKETLQEYRLLDLERNLFSNSHKFFATTYFCVENLTHSWNIPTSLLDERESVYSKFISDNSQKTVFLIRLVKMDRIWKIEIRPSSSTNDDVYVRCFISIKNAFKVIIASDVSECLCKSNTWWQYSTFLHLHNGSLIINGQYFTPDCELFYLDFTFVYPSGKCTQQINNATSSYASNTECIVKDVQHLMRDLEDLYYTQNEADTTIVVGSKKFKAHKCLLCARSPYFRAAFEHNMAEKNNNQVSRDLQF